MDFTREIKEHTLEYFDDTHTYLVDGVIVPSITSVLKRGGDKYAGVSPDVLKRAQVKGIEVHDAIERYCKHGEIRDLTELNNFIFLQKKYGFEVIDNEVPVILFMDDKPVCAGRLDMVLEMNGEIGGADIKRTAKLDKEYLAYQLNLYRIAYYQSYGEEWKFLKGIHLRDDIRKFVSIPINESMAWQAVLDYMEDINEPS